MRVCMVFIVFLWVTGLAWGLPAPDHEREQVSILNLPPDPISFQPGTGSAIASRYCLMCHSAEYVYTQPPHAREHWMEIVNKMKITFGCPISNEDMAPLIDYLVTQNSLQPSPSVPPAQHDEQKETPGQSPTHAGNPQKGKALYERHCETCHGPGGKGDGPIGQALIPPAANLTLLGKQSDTTILDTLRNGRPGTAMPAWKNDLNTLELNHLLSFLRTLTP
ncbi:cytochrome c [Candidatus Nitrospira neomarina]|uniref:C-type cytochrome n=1 Tax=Candidatus Nitrospira neomarina TaxID=3020899 RepID=A0AA96JV23_9BACT|nr:c-type cytochrome [Candidatus Nitrospira neomarina]WNM61302.1 c-type cytochrome [Candidatus Nitrospira neomarina]